WTMRTVGLLLAVLTGCMLLSMQAGPGSHPGGGMLGSVLAAPMMGTLGLTGGVLVSLAIFLGGITLFTGLSWIAVVAATGWAALPGQARGGAQARHHQAQEAQGSAHRAAR